MADTKFFITLLTILAVCSITTAMIVQSYQSWNTFGNDSYMGKCTGASGVYCPINPGIYNKLTGNISLTNNNMDNSSYFLFQGKIYASKYWHWNYGIGYISEQSSAPSYPYHYIWLKGVEKDPNGYYTSTYTINNSVHEHFIITIHDTRDSFFGIEFLNNEIAIPGIIPYTYNAKYSFPGVSSLNLLVIKTRYNPDTDHLLCYVNDMKIIDDTQFDYSGFLHGYGTETDYYGGVGANKNYITFISYFTDNGQSTNIEIEEPAGLGFVWEKILNLVPWGREIWNFINTFLSIANPFAGVTTTDISGTPIVPWWLSVLFDIIIIGIVAYGVTILRGN